MLEQLVAVLGSPVLLNHCLHFLLQEPRVDQAAFLQDVWVHMTKEANFSKMKIEILHL